ncbi:AfsR/SARP family transcriptional regulator [Kutzneria kofuensis]|uniref:DNA-binding SARP family transcriptional activator/tetratricopeptide (TPR) repeat protein n=1 Tax=Kutzneria kofuensis TaxID=103725 RepID=A0A7W9NEL3_9PSEU|nr:BTAD domain-containing putative transcriptional regulator [Kutzneria kofuensis]MBB5890452.1 DNA-binding SARP family transcriptional activator/tetratricopeptide (TPR) repeat protein [Kutzneria kofuensis]
MLAGSPRFRLLGPLQVLVDGREVAVSAAKHRTLLACLLLKANNPVATDEIIARLWDDRPPPGARATVRAYVMRLRNLLASPDTIRTTPTGYLIRVEPNQLDLLRVRELVAEPDGVREAWALWRGPALADVPSDSLHHTEGPALEELRLHVLTRRVDLDLAEGRHVEVCAELVGAVSEHPLHERLAGQLMLALYRSGRAAEALAHYTELRRRLAEDLGTDPGPEIRRLHQQILTNDRALSLSSGPATARVPRQLPATPRRFTGRTRELAVLDGGGAFVISAIGGVGGVGKTWLALHWAHRNLHRFPDGQLYVNLRGFDPAGPPTDPSAALRSFLAALGVEPGAIPPELAAQSGLYRSLVADKRVLVVLDNALDSEQVLPLLPGGDSCTTVITSRNRLAALVVNHGATLVSLDALADAEARQLLVAWLGTERIDAEPAAVAELVDRCGGLPLALGIVAARALADPHIPLAETARQLRVGAVLDVLDGGELGVNLRAVFDCSYRALSPSAAELFRLLAVAPGTDISLTAMRSLAGHDVVELDELERAHLVQRSGDRFRMHDLVRHYAAERAAGTDTAAALHRLVDFYLQTLRTRMAVLRPNRPAMEHPEPVDGCVPEPIPDRPSAMAWFAAEQANVRAAQELAAEFGWHRHVWLIAWYQNINDYDFGLLREELASWRLALAATRRMGRTPLVIKAHHMLGLAHTQLGEVPDALRHLRQALELAEETGDLAEQARVHRGLSWVYEREGDDHTALRHALRNHEILATFGDPVREGRALNAVGWYRARTGDHVQAQAACRRALELLDGTDDSEGRAATLDSLGLIAHGMGDSDRALAHLGRALTIFRDLGNLYQEADTLTTIGDVHRTLGVPAESRRAWQRALDLYRAQHRTAKADLVERRLRDLAGDGRR